AHPRDDEDVVVKPTYGQRWQDQRAVAVDEGLIAAVLGECHGITENRNPYVPPNRLVCIDEQTGQVRWTRSSGRFLDNEPTRSPDRRAGGVNLQLTHFVGTPVIHRGVVYALLRRTKSEGDTHSVWLMAYDAGDSSLLWYRHLSLVSLSYTNRDSYRVCPQMILHGDTLYLTDSLATVAAIDPHIGAYHWLRVLPVGSGDRKTLVAKTKGLIAPPVMTEAGLLVSLSNSKDRLVLIDPADGSMLRSFREDPQLSAAEYLIAAAGGALVVSPTSVSYWDEKEAAVGWTATLSPGETVVARGDASLRYAVLPTNQRLLVLDRATGDVLDSAPALTGNLVVREGEMLALSDRRVHAYTNWERVYDRLIQHIEERPTDPSAGLSLASIAMRQDGRSDSVLKGVGHALEAIERQPPARVGAIRERVFEQLRELTMQAKAPALRRSLYASLALVTQTAAQEATYHLDAGLYFAEIGETQRAVDHLHAVVAEPAFAAVAYEFDGADRSASAIAQRTIQSLIDRFGRGVYAQQDAMAEAAFATLQSDGQPDPVALTAVARRYPLSPVAGRVMLEAARARVDQGRLIDAASLFKQAIDLANDQTQRDRAAGALLSFYLQTQRPDRAGDLLDRLEARYPGLMPMADEQPLSSVEWRERIDAVEPLRRTLAPIAGAMTTPVLLPGRLVGDAPGVETMHERKRLYLHHDSGIIAAHGLGDPLQPSWTAASPVETKELLLLADSDGQVLFWSVDRGVVFAMDRSTGERIWSTTVRFDEPGNDRPLDDRRASGGTGWLIAVSETVLCIGERGTARLLAIDRASGNVTWRVALDMTAMTGLDADGWTVAAVGLGGLPQQVRSGRLSLLLLTDAEPQLEQGDVRLGVSPFAVDLRRGEATVLGSSGVASIDTRTGNTLWSKRFLNHQLSGAHALSDDLIAAETTDGHIHLLDRRSQGQTLGKTAVRSAGDRRSIDLHAADGRFWVRSGRGVFCLDEEPIVQWRDAVQTPRQVSQRLLVGRDVVAVLAQPNPAPVPNGASLLLFEQEGGRLLQQYTLGPFENPLTLERAIPWGTGLVIPSTNQTLFVPGSNE
ncbi:MAG: PQQ-binding-like beta-propeller repeat protein, partial [Phycisphaeraceae bacterium]